MSSRLYSLLKISSMLFAHALGGSRGQACVLARLMRQMSDCWILQLGLEASLKKNVDAVVVFVGSAWESGPANHRRVEETCEDEIVA